MWSPTHVKVTVQRARELLIKGKNGVNDAFVTIALGKEKYQTSVQEKAPSNVEWHEECDLEIPKHGNTAEITLTAFHRNFLGVDEFLGTVSIPLAEFDVYERPRNRWYMLRGKPGKEKGKDKARGELEVKVGFLVKSGSLSDLSKRDKHKSSLGQLSHMAHSVGGSLLSIGSLEKKKGLKKLAKSLGRVGRGSRKSHDGTFPTHDRGQRIGDADPGVISEGESDDEFRFDELSHKSSGSSLNTHGAQHTPVSGSMENLAGGEFLRRSASGHSAGPPLKPPRAIINPSVGSPAPHPPTDEWEQKLCGWKDTSPADTLTRRAVLHIQPEEDEEVSPAPNLTVPQSQTPQISSAPTSPNVSASHAIAAASVAAATIASSGTTLVPPGSPGLNPAQKFNSSFGSQQSIGSGSGGGDEEEKERAKDKGNLKSKLKHFLAKDTKSSSAPPDQLAERIIIGRERDRAAPSSPEQTTRIPPEVLSKFEGKSKEELIQMLVDLQRRHESQSKRLSDLEDYLDQLLLRVMEATPGLLQNPFVSCKAQAHFTIAAENLRRCILSRTEKSFFSVLPEEDKKFNGE